jgi:hypothetical protein
VTKGSRSSPRETSATLGSRGPLPANRFMNREFSGDRREQKLISTIRRHPIPADRAAIARSDSGRSLILRRADRTT